MKCPDGCGILEHGECNKMTGECVCQERWTGPNCDQKTCPGKPPCTDPNQGECIDNPNNPSCKCLEAWKGESCSEKTCPGKNSEGYSNPCSDHGTCGDDNVCICTDAYKGDDCSEDKKATNPTTEVPTITTSTNTKENSTTESTTECPGNPPCTSPNQGECNNNPSDPMCKCFEAWTGESCSEKTCPGKNPSGHSNPCSGHGTCGDDNVCSCTDAFKGDDCSKDTTNFQNGLQCNARLLSLSILVFLIPVYV